MNKPPRPPALPFVRHEKNGDVLVTVHVVPNAASTAPAGLHGEAGEVALRLRLHAPPVDGKANAALVKWLASCLGIATRDVSVAHGLTSRRKQLRVTARAATDAGWAALEAVSAGDGT